MFFLLSKEPVGDTLNAGELLEGKSVGIEVLKGEPHANLREIFISGKIDDVRIIDV